MCLYWISCFTKEWKLYLPGSTFSSEVSETCLKTHLGSLASIFRAMLVDLCTGVLAVLFESLRPSLINLIYFRSQTHMVRCLADHTCRSGGSDGPPGAGWPPCCWSPLIRAQTEQRQLWSSGPGVLQMDQSPPDPPFVPEPADQGWLGGEASGSHVEEQMFRWRINRKR